MAGQPTSLAPRSYPSSYPPITADLELGAWSIRALRALLGRRDHPPIALKVEAGGKIAAAAPPAFP